MQPFPEFAQKNKAFWAYIKLISEKLGYSERRTHKLRRYTFEEIINLMKDENISTSEILDETSKKETALGRSIVKYLNIRSEIIETHVAPNLMNRNQAKKEFEKAKKRIKPKCHLPLNKQKREKRHYSYLVGLVNMLTEEALGGCYFDDNPRGLTLITQNKKPIRVLSRWMDGAYPSRIDPIAVWEIKEYYGTTTFGSRVADGVYETMLDGEELKELEEKENIKIKHYLIVDDKFTWWDKGKSYLCRIIDILNSGLVDEVIFGREILDRWPKIMKSIKVSPRKQ